MNKYPHGKLNEQDEGAALIEVTLEKKQVVIKFEKPMIWIGLDKKSALLMAHMLVEKANLINTGTTQ